MRPPTTPGSAGAVWTIRYHDGGPDDPDGWCDYPTKTISIRRGLAPAKRRCVLAHELVHARRGPCLDDPVLVAREEHTVCRTVAQVLIPMDDLVTAAEEVEYPTAPALAEALQVDIGTVRYRMETLTEAERWQLTWCARRRDRAA